MVLRPLGKLDCTEPIGGFLLSGLYSAGCTRDCSSSTARQLHLQGKHQVSGHGRLSELVEALSPTQACNGHSSIFATKLQRMLVDFTSENILGIFW